MIDCYQQKEFYVTKQLIFTESFYLSHRNWDGFYDTTTYVYYGSLLGISNLMIRLPVNEEKKKFSGNNVIINFFPGVS